MEALNPPQVYLSVFLLLSVHNRNLQGQLSQIPCMHSISMYFRGLHVPFSYLVSYIGVNNIDDLYHIDCNSNFYTHVDDNNIITSPNTYI